MIQRIQTVYLLLTTFVAILFLSGDIILFKNGTSLVLTGINTEGIAPENLEKNWFLAALLGTAAVLPFLVIFLYKNRKLQMKLVVLMMFAVLGMIGILGYYSYEITGSSATSIVFSYKLLLPVFMLVFLFLAYRGIKRDEEIVRSYDRLR